MKIKTQIEELRTEVRTLMQNQGLTLRQLALAIPMNYTTLRVFLHGAPIQIALLERIEIWVASQGHALENIDE